MNIDDMFFNRKKFEFDLKNFRFWLDRYLEFDDMWVDVWNMIEWKDVFPNSADEKLLTMVEEKRRNARAHLEQEKRRMIVWIRQAPKGRKQ